MIINNMKIGVFWFPILVIFSAACGPVNSNVNSIQNSNESKLEKIPSDTSVDTSSQTIIPDYEIDSACKSLVLEIVSGRYGMVTPKGKVLDFRVIRNGQIEFDSYDDTNRISRTRGQISSSQVEGLVRLLNSVEVKSPKSEYITGSPCLDATFEKTIKFCPTTDSPIKEILIKECRPLDSSDGAEVPSEVLKIVNYVDKIKG